MNQIRGLKKALRPALLVAILVLPAGLNKRAIANANTLITAQPVPNESSNCQDEEEYTVTPIKFLNAI